jgi:hypothetical protein
MAPVGPLAFRLVFQFGGSWVAWDRFAHWLRVRRSSFSDSVNCW